MEQSFEKYLHVQGVENDVDEALIKNWSEGQERYLASEFKHIRHDMRILDVGCGNGVGLEWFQNNGFSAVTGVDLGEQKLHEARRRGHKVIQGDMHNLAIFPEHSFDIVYASHSLEHAYDVVKVLQEFHRILTPSGKLFVVLPYIDNGAEYVHYAKHQLGTDIPDNGETVVSTIERSGFLCESKNFDSFRESEIWLTFTKDMSPSEKHVLLQLSKETSALGNLVFVLQKLASQHQHITEFGVQHGASTVALAMGRPKLHISYEFVDVLEDSTKELIKKYVPWKYVIADTTKITIESTDLLFIDTKHTYTQLLSELFMHAPKVRHLIVLHDTYSMGVVGEDLEARGLLYALNEFLEKCPEWYIEKTIPFDNGLTILRRYIHE